VRVALVHDYLTQRGGGERVALAMAAAFPDAPLYTSFYEPAKTYPDFARVDVRALPINKLAVLRRDHRRALPLLASSFGRLEVDADVVVCSSSGWAHGVRTKGAKIVYCHTPARWLYQGDRYTRQTTWLRRAALHALRAPLVAWDAAAARSASRYLANSTLVRDRIRETYGIEAEVLPPPYAFDVTGQQEALGLTPGFYLCVARLLPYKNVDAVLGAFRLLPDERVVVVGSGPYATALRKIAPPNAFFLEEVSDAELRWLYASCRAVIAAAYEDFGLTPIEGGAFGKPAVVLRFGGFLDTIEDRVNGIFFEQPTPEDVAGGVEAVSALEWDETRIREHCESFAPAAFIERLHAIVDEVN
jgi:glycosyltransferase involved in cell wall biosynthesis